MSQFTKKKTQPLSQPGLFMAVSAVSMALTAEQGDVAPQVKCRFARLFTIVRPLEPSGRMS